GGWALLRVRSGRVVRRGRSARALAGERHAAGGGGRHPAELSGLRRPLCLRLRSGARLRVRRLPARLPGMVSVLWNGGVRHRLLLPTVASPPFLSAPVDLGLLSALQPVVEPLGLRLQLLDRVPPCGLPLAPGAPAASAARSAALVRPGRVSPAAAG